MASIAAWTSGANSSAGVSAALSGVTVAVGAAVIACVGVGSEEGVAVLSSLLHAASTSSASTQVIHRTVRRMIIPFRSSYPPISVLSNGAPMGEECKTLPGGGSGDCQARQSGRNPTAWAGRALMALHKSRLIGKIVVVDYLADQGAPYPRRASCKPATS